jgi:hypothetical protein
MLASGFYHNDLGMVLAFDVLGLSDRLRGECLRMMKDLVPDFPRV